MVFDDHFHMAISTASGPDCAVYQGLGVAHTTYVERYACRHASSQSNACLDWARIIDFAVKTLLLIVSLILLSACASAPPVRFYWTKDGHSYDKENPSEELERQWAACNTQLGVAPFTRTPDQGGGSMGLGAALGDISADMAMREQFLTNCMRAQGWRKNIGARPTSAPASSTPVTK